MTNPHEEIRRLQDENERLRHELEECEALRKLLRKGTNREIADLSTENVVLQEEIEQLLLDTLSEEE